MSEMFEQSAVFHEVAKNYISGVGLGKEGYKSRKAIAAKSEEQIEVATSILELVARQKPRAGDVQLKQHLAGIAGHLKKYIKLMESVIHGLNTKTLEYNTLRRLVAVDAANEIKGFAGLIRNYMPDDMDYEDFSNKVAEISREKDWKDALQHYKNLAKEREKYAAHTQEKAEDFIKNVKDDKAREELREYLPFVEKLPINLQGRPFSSVRMPIVPYMNYKLMSKSFLRKTDIDYQFIGNNIVVFRDQFLLAFDVAYLKERHLPKERSRRDSAAAKPSDKKVQANIKLIEEKMEELVLNAVNTINRVSDQKYELASSHFLQNPNKASIFFAWLLPRETYRLLAQFSTGGNTLSKVSWGFPWSTSALYQ